MNLKTLTFAVALLVLAAGAAYWLRRPPPPPADDPRTGQAFLNAALAARADHVRLSDQGKTVELARQPDGSWRVPGYYDFPADFAKLGGLMNDLAGAKIRRLVTARPDRLARLEFKDTSVTLTGQGRTLWSATLGKAGAYGERYVRFGNEDRGYLAALNVWLEADPKNWVDHTVLNLKDDEIAAVELALSDGTLWSAKREKPGAPWTAAGVPAGKAVDAAKVASLLNDFARVSFTDTSDPADANVAAARAHARTVALTTFAGVRYALVVGRKPEEKIAKPPAPPTGPAPAVPAPPAGATPEAVAAAPQASPKPAEPAVETVPAGPVYVFVTSSDPHAPVNQLMTRRAFQISEWVFNRLPAKADDLLTAAPTEPKAPVK